MTVTVSGAKLTTGQHPEPARFFESNYVLIRKRSRFEEIGKNHFSNKSIPIAG